jgi:hypothetical protein
METEGVIRFQLEFEPDKLDIAHLIGPLNAWRSLLFRLGWIGQDANRYGGLAYGNVSLRLDQQQFLISATQTGGRELLGPDDYCLVTDFHIAANRIQARGQNPPSSESLTHAAIYGARDEVQCVLHVHAPLMWDKAADLGLAVTPGDAPYGTPAMAMALRACALNDSTGPICMGGHQDGVMAFGLDPSLAAWALLEAEIRAMQTR